MRQNRRTRRERKQQIEVPEAGEEGQGGEVGVEDSAVAGEEAEEEDSKQWKHLQVIGLLGDNKDVTSTLFDKDSIGSIPKPVWITIQRRLDRPDGF